MTVAAVEAGCRRHAVSVADTEAYWRAVDEHRPDVAVCECCRGPASLAADAPAVVFPDGYRFVLESRCKRCVEVAS